MELMDLDKIMDLEKILASLDPHKNLDIFKTGGHDGSQPRDSDKPYQDMKFQQCPIWLFSSRDRICLLCKMCRIVRVVAWDFYRVARIVSS